MTEASPEVVVQRVVDNILFTQTEIESKINNASEQLKKNRTEALEQLKEEYCDELEELQLRKSEFASAVGSFLLLSSQDFVKKVEEEIRLANYKIYSRRAQIIKAVSGCEVTIVVGATGSGKSSQILRYISEIPGISQATIAMTQTRKLAASILARQVADEWKVQLGKEVCVQTSKFGKIHQGTKVKVTTDRVLLDELLEDSLLLHYSCVVIDCAHERTLDTDILLAFLKRCCEERRLVGNPLRLVISTTTATPFEDYFAGAPVITHLGGHHAVETKFCGPSRHDFVEHAIEVLTEVLLNEKKNGNSEAPSGIILVFLPGYSAIEQAIFRMASSRISIDSTFIPLHGKLDADEERMLLMPSTKRKVIFASRIAESSVVIKGVSTVIDSGLAYAKTFKQRITCRRLDFISKEAASQRAKHATKSIYRLFSKEQFDKFPEATVPEIKKSDLSQSILRIIHNGPSEVMSFPFLHSPTKEALMTDVEHLAALGALSYQTTSRGPVCAVTSLGLAILKLPTNPTAAGMLLKSVESGNCYESMSKIIAVMSESTRLFDRQSNSQEKLAYLARKNFIHPKSDVLTLLSLYNEWLQQSPITSVTWCRERNLKVSALRRASAFNQEIDLAMTEFVNHNATTSSTNKSNRYPDTQILDILLRYNMMNLAFLKPVASEGYNIVTLSALKSAFLHSQSIFCSRSKMPKVVLFTRVVQTAANASLCDITEVDPDILEDRVKLESQQKHPIVSNNEQQLICKHLEQLPEETKFELKSSILKRLTGRDQRNLAELQQELTKLLGFHPLYSVAVIIERNTVALICPKFRAARVKDAFLQHVHQLEQEQKNNLLEVKLVGDTRGVFEKGFKIQQLLLPGEYLTVQVKNLPPQHTVYGLRRTVLAICPPAAILQVDCAVDPESKLQIGKITLVSHRYAAAVVAQLKSFLLASKAELELIHVEPLHAGALQPSGKFYSTIKVIWYASTSNSLAFVEFSSSAHAVVALQHLYGATVDGFAISARQNRKEPSKLTINGLNPYTDEISLMKAFSSLGCEGILHIFLKRTPEATPSEATVERHLHNIFDVCGPITKTKCMVNTHKNSAFITFSTKEAADTALDLDGSIITCPGLLHNNTKMHVLRNLSMSTKVSRDVYNEIKDDIGDWMDNMGLTGKLNIKIQPYLQNAHAHMIHINSEDFKGTAKDVVKAKAQLDSILKGTMFALPGDKAYYILGDGSLIRRIQRSRKVTIEKDPENKALRIFGEGTAQALQDLKSHCNSLQVETRTIVVQQLSKLHVKKTKGSFSLLDTVKATFKHQLKSIQVKHESREVVITGISSAVNQAATTIQQTCAGTSKEKAPTGDVVTCPICFSDDVERASAVCLELCEHHICKDCFKHQLDSADEFPIKCAQCNIEILQSDIEAALTPAEFENLCTRSFRHFRSITANYNPCTTPSCKQVFRINSAPHSTKNSTLIQCDCCMANICTYCKTNFHDDFTCAENQAMMKDDMPEFLLARYNIKRCPRCREGIQKTDGCNHLACSKCSAHFCWQCSYVSSSAKEVYDHMRASHGSIG